jgi:hypothetical protein
VPTPISNVGWIVCSIRNVYVLEARRPARSRCDAVAPPATELVCSSLLIVNARDPTKAAEAESYCVRAWAALAIVLQRKSALVPDD